MPVELVPSLVQSLPTVLGEASAQTQLAEGFIRLSPAPRAAMLVLDGNPQETINVVSVSLAIGLVGVPVASQAAATIWSRFRYKDRQDEKSHGEVDSSSRPAAWVVSLLIYSYGLLIPALCLTLFNMMIGAVDAVVLEAKSESTFGLISLLAETGSWTGAVLVTTFAIVIPLLKLYLLLHAECIRRSKDVRQVSRARHYISFVQVISKWACPDMIAYIFLLYLVRHLNRPPINGLFTLDIGFACYTLFCWGSTISSLGIHPPRLPDESRKMDLRSPADPFTIKIFGKKGAAALMLLLFMIFAVLFILGMRWPVLGLRLDAKILKQNGLPPWQIRVMEDMHVAEHAKADVTIFQCLQTLAEFQAEAFDASALLAIIMLAVFVIGLPVLDMLTIAISSLRFFVSDAAAIVLEEAGFSLVKLSRRLRKLAMLDVLLLGVIVVVLSASIYRSQGMVLFPGWGLLVLTGAELAHYAAGWSLWGLTRVVRPAASEAKALDHPSSGTETTLEEATDDSDSTECSL
ncbi:rha-1 [Symbiodinium sp. KB8]|nr:rha-1 [Symbiodinium sp. KB8]